VAVVQDVMGPVDGSWTGLTVLLPDPVKVSLNIEIRFSESRTSNLIRISEPKRHHMYIERAKMNVSKMYFARENDQ
jgi:hypothetical protein